MRQFLTGISGFTECRSRPPDLIILDVRLPDVDGVTVLGLLKDEARLREVPVLMLSAQSAWRLLAAALDAGAEGYAYKPIDFPSLQQLIAQAYARSPRAVRERESESAV